MTVQQSNENLKNKAVKLREKGLSYSEIKAKISVAKSTLSYWLRDIKLDKKGKKRLRGRIGMTQPMAAKAHRDKRIRKTKKIIRSAKKEIGDINKENLFYIGAALYWAEGSKQKEHNVGQRVTFNNSDPSMVKIYIKWLLECVGVEPEELDFEIYSHENIRGKEGRVVKYWSEIAGFSESSFGKIYYKKDKKKKYRKNQGKNYYGLLRISVRKSTDLNRKITGWIEGICQQCGVVCPERSRRKRSE